MNRPARDLRAPAPTRLPGGFTWAADVQPESEPEDLIEGLLPKRSYVALFGRRGSGKSFLALEMAFRGAVGEPFFGRPTAAFGTLYCVGEKRARFPKRLEAWRASNPESGSPSVLIKWGVPDLTRSESVDCFITEVRGLKEEFERRGTPLGLVVLDTLARCLKHGNVSDPDAAGSGIEAIGKIIDKLGVSVMPLAHTAKAEGADTVKGAGEWEDAADALLRIDRKDGQTHRTLTVAKQSDEADGASLAFDLDVVGLGETTSGRPVSSCVVRQIEPEAFQGRAKTLRGPGRFAVEALQYLLDQSDTVPAPPLPGIPSHWRAVSMQAWRDRAFTSGLVVQGDTAGNQRTKWSRAIAAAKEAGMVRIEGDWAIPLRPLQGVSGPRL